MTETASQEVCEGVDAVLVSTDGEPDCAFFDIRADENTDALHFDFDGWDVRCGWLTPNVPPESLRELAAWCEETADRLEAAEGADS